MLTKREQQLLDMIEEKPDVTQNELAQRCGITRSSVAVHISNLMKKGVITGKGYIVRNRPYILVIGGQNIDIFGRPSSPPSKNDSTPGKVHVAEGGVGRNIATNLALLGEEVKFITVFGNDASAERMAASCRRLGLDTSPSLMVPQPTATYLLILNAVGSVEMSVADTDVFSSITPSYLEGKRKLLARAGACVADTNLSREALQWIADNCRCPLFVRTISSHKAARVAPVLDKVHTLAANLNEAEVLVGFSLNDDAAVKKAAAALLERGVRQVYLMRGPGGIYAANGKRECVLNGIPAKPLNAVGAAESFTAAAIWAWQQGYPLEKSTLAGSAAANICMASDESVNPQLTRSRLLAEMKKLGMDFAAACQPDEHKPNRCVP